MLSDRCIVLDNSTHTIEIRHGRLLTASHGVVSRSDRYSDVDVVNGAIFPHPQSYTSDVTCYVITNDVTNGGLPSADNPLCALRPTAQLQYVHDCITD